MSVLIVFCSSCVNPIMPLEKVVLSSWPSYGKNSGFYLAIDRGYFEDEGIQLVIQDSFQNAMLLLESGDAQLTQVLCSSALSAIEQGGDYRIVAIRDAIIPVGTISLKSEAIRTPADYEGKLWGHSESFSPELAILPALAERSSFDPDSVDIVHLEFPARLPALLNGDVDFISAWWGSGYPPQLLAARQQGIEIDFLRWSDFGIDAYGECLVARNDWLISSPVAAAGFFAAADRGFRDAIADPESAVNATIRLNPSQEDQKAVIALSWEQSEDLVYDSKSLVQKLFWIDANRLLETRRLILGDTSNSPIEETFTNEFLP